MKTTTSWTVRASEVVAARLRNAADVLALHMGHCAANPAQWNDPIYGIRLAHYAKLADKLATRGARKAPPADPLADFRLDRQLTAAEGANRLAEIEAWREEKAAVEGW